MRVRVRKRIALVRGLGLGRATVRVRRAMEGKLGLPLSSKFTGERLRIGLVAKKKLSA